MTVQDSTMSIYSHTNLLTKNISFFFFIIYIITVSITVVNGGWIDADTPIDDYHVTSFLDGEDYELVFSDEFNTDGRHFMDGHDPRWTAIHKDDYTNDALQYYNENLVSTRHGYLNITTIVEDIEFIVPGDEKKQRDREKKKNDGDDGSRRRTSITSIDGDTVSPQDTTDIEVPLHSDSHDHTLSATSGTTPIAPGYTKRVKNYQSGMIQGWNKFCFTGGIVEISAQLPGHAEIGGLWPAMWMLGNLARATYVGSSNNIWPWSYNTCNKELQPKQLISACNTVNHFDLLSKQGRGSPEIDILEAMAGKEKLINTPINRPYYSASLQVSPGIKSYRPNTAQPPQPGLWYDHDLYYGKNSSLNIFFYGMHLEASTERQSYFTDALSANRDLQLTHFMKQHKYRLEWKIGRNGYISWYLDNELVYHIDANALNITGAIIPEEPM